MSCSIWLPNELYHHGIGGQKWGVKHGPPYPLSLGKSSDSKKKKIVLKNGEVKKKEKKESNNKQLSTHYLTRRKLKGMTDAEVSAKINRLRQEKELVQLSRDIEQHGEGIVRKALKNVGQKTLETALTGGALYLLNAAGEGKFDVHALMKSMSRGQISGGSNNNNKQNKKKENKIGF